MLLSKMLNPFKLFRRATDSSSAKLSAPMMTKLAELLLENERLKEELRLRDLAENCEYDV